MRNQGGQQVEAGYFWNVKSWEIVSILRDGDHVLPGGTDQSYVRLPGLAALALAPILGAAFMFALPVIGFVIFAGWVGVHMSRAAEWTFYEVASVLAPKWEPGLAYFAGRKAKKAAAKAMDAGSAKPGEKAHDLLDEVEARRQAGEK